MKFLAKIAIGFKVAESRIEFLAGKTGTVPGGVVAREAGAVRDQVARGDARREHVVIEAKIGQVFAHRFVPIEFALA